MSNSTSPISKLPLGETIRLILEQRHMTGRALAREADVGVTTIQNLLKAGTDEAVAGIHPLVLQKVARALDLDQIQVLEAAGYLVFDDEDDIHLPTLSGEYVRLCFENLPANYQKALIGVLHAMMEAVGEEVEGQQKQQLLDAAHHLREQYPLFQEPFGLRREIGRVLGNVTRTTTRGLLLKGVVERINQVYDPAQNYDIEDVLVVIRHPYAFTILNYLLPRQEISTSLEKLYWLSHNASHGDQPANRLPHQDRAAIRALWDLLEWSVKSATDANSPNKL